MTNAPMHKALASFITLCEIDIAQMFVIDKIWRD